MYTRITSQYEHALACAFHRVTSRGLLVDQQKLSVLRSELLQIINDKCKSISQRWGINVYVGRVSDPATYNSKTDLNLNSSEKLIEFLKSKKYKVPRSRKTGEESAEQLAMLRLYAHTNDEAIKEYLEISKTKTVLTRYVNARLSNDTFFSSYNVAGTVTGRRGSKKHIFGLGNNAQNFPKYSELGLKFRECLIARPGKIFFSADQKQAEDWVVVALSENTEAYNDLLAGVDRHKKLASFIFSLPLDQVTKYPHRFLGKKFRHASNYGMGKTTASDNLAKEGFAFTPDECYYLIEKVHEYDPSIRKVFHQYIQDTLSRERKLFTPLGRERIFFGLHPRRDNTQIFMDAYSYIPQSSVGDNNGMAVLYLDEMAASVVHENHDSVTTEIDDNEAEILRMTTLYRQAYDRELIFHNGWKIKIPLEFELGYDMKNTVQASDMSDESVLRAYRNCKEMLEQRRASLNAAQNTGAIMA